mmetsp:Transcript_62856/g.137375  ORF Transcript_62856/g.137375 Transcript_62856/m.137375 type:complete len:231 (+) Transcript_62856:764-1456(+)
MHEVESQVRSRGFREHGLELLQHGPGRRLSLDEPAVVEVHFALGEKYHGSRARRQCSEAREQVRMMLEDVGQREVVVSNHLAGLVPVVGCMSGGYSRTEGLHLHDVVEGRQAQHGLYPLSRVTESIPYHSIHAGPVHIVVELHSPLVWRFGPGPAMPLLVVAEAEAPFAVTFQSQKPVDCEQRPYCSLILHGGAVSGGGRILFVAECEEESKLWKGSDAILEELSKAVGR